MLIIKLFLHASYPLILVLALVDNLVGILAAALDAGFGWGAGWFCGRDLACSVSGCRSCSENCHLFYLIGLLLDWILVAVEFTVMLVEV